MTKKKRRSDSVAVTKKILLVDDHPLFREGLVRLIQTDSDLAIAAEAGCAEEAFVALDAGPVDLILLDITLPGVNGIDFLKDVRAKWPRVRVLVLSMHEESVYAERALRAGAQGYIMKQEPGGKVLEAIRCVLKGELFVSASLASRMLKLFVSKNGKDERTSVERLSDRELQVYTQIGSGFSTQEVAEQLGLSVKTIQTYREHIKRKLGLRNATDLVHHATHWVQNEKSSPPQG